MILRRMGLPDVDFTDATAIKSREAVAMFRKDGRIYKLLRYSEKIHEQKDALKDEVSSPVIRLNRGTYQFLDGNNLLRSVDVLAIEMKQIDSTNFFQMSNGGEARLIGWIDDEFEKDRLRKIERALRAAKTAKLTDPQGFFMTAGADPIIFIDLHAGKVETSELDKVIARAGDNLEK